MENGKLLVRVRRGSLVTLCCQHSESGELPYIIAVALQRSGDLEFRHT